jgi:heptosyltransferase-2
MGDIVLTSPVVRCLKNQIVSVEIHYLTKNIYKEIFAANPYIDKIYGINSQISEIAEALKQEKYDVLIDLHDNLRTRQLKSILKIKKTYTYNKQSFKRWLLTAFKIDYLNNHVVDRYFGALKPLNIINDGKGLDYFISENDDISRAQLPFTHIAGFCVIVVGAKHFTKTIPQDKLAFLCREIKMPIILVGGKEDEQCGAALSEIDNFKIFNACGRFNISQSASVIKKAKFVITGDTGMMHIAAAFQKRIISIWGSTRKNLGFYPYQNTNNTVYIENEALKCRPCHRFGLANCPKKHFKCMQDLDMQKVVEVL